MKFGQGLRPRSFKSRKGPFERERALDCRPLSLGQLLYRYHNLLCFHKYFFRVIQILTNVRLTLITAMKTAIVLTRTALSCAGVDQDLVEMARFVQVIDWEQMSSRIVKL